LEVHTVREWLSMFDESRYRTRQPAGTPCSFLKREFSGDLKTRTPALPVRDRSCTRITCRLHRFLPFPVIEMFYRAKLKKYST